MLFWGQTVTENLVSSRYLQENQLLRQVLKTQEVQQVLVLRVRHVFPNLPAVLVLQRHPEVQQVLFLLARQTDLEILQVQPVLEVLAHQVLQLVQKVQTDLALLEVLDRQVIHVLLEVLRVLQVQQGHAVQVSQQVRAIQVLPECQQARQVLCVICMIGNDNSQETRHYHKRIHVCPCISDKHRVIS